MCGRIACALGVDDLSCATACKSKKDVYVKTNIHKSTTGSQSSYNVPPTMSVPVLVSARHTCFQEENIEPTTDTNLDNESDRLLVSMRFGIIPHWLKAENVKSYNHETHLCKIERMLESKLYNPLYQKGYRCAVPCIGYYEWQSTKSSNKQPFFFYDENNSVSDLTSKKSSFDAENGWTGLHLLYLAGIFSTNTNCEGKIAYSFAIITKEASEEWKYVHHRMPVVLQSGEHVHNWIEYNTSPSMPVFEILHTPITNLSAHPVDKTFVNKTKNNLSSCIIPIDTNKPTNKLMQSWLGNAKIASVQVKKESGGSHNTPSNIKKRYSLDSWLASVPKKPKKE